MLGGCSSIWHRKSTSENPLSTSCSFDPSIDVKKEKLKYTTNDYIKGNAFPLSSCPSVGNVKGLVIPIWFNNSSIFIKNNNNKENVHEDLNLAFNGTPENTGWHSVSSFYKEESKSNLNMEFTVANWYEVSDSFVNYGKGITSVYTLTAELVEKAINNYFQSTNDNRLAYDSDKDGYLDYVCLIYGAPNYISLREQEYDNLWAYVNWIQDNSKKDVNNPGVNCFMWASYNFMYNKSTALSRAGSEYGGGDTLHCKIDTHAFIHESGHTLGLEDYYDYSDYSYVPAGGFSMQDFNIGSHDPYSIMSLNWASVYQPTKTCSITINDFQNSHDLILLSNHKVTSIFDEYFLIELYTPTGLNYMDSHYKYSNKELGPGNVGIRLWHVDARLTYAKNSSTWSDANDLVNDPYTSKSKYGIYYAFSNTYDTFSNGGSPLGTKYKNYNLLQLIRNNKEETFLPNRQIKNSDLFIEGEEFSQTLFAKQFINNDKMNNGSNLNWSFVVKSINNNTAVIDCIKY